MKGGDAYETQKNAPYVSEHIKGWLQYPHRKTEGFCLPIIPKKEVNVNEHFKSRFNVPCFY